MVAASELTGRGGGHFPVARKWRAVLAATERTGVLPLVVANGSEGEPASAKDAALLCYRPHLVLDGLAQAAAAVRATESVLWLHGDAHAAHRAVVRALEERRASGLVETPVRLATGPSRYLSGESSAVVRALSGGPALPESRRVPTATSGVDGRPTLVQNVETLARVGLLARSGVDAHHPTSLVTVVVGDRRTVLEVEPGVTRLAGAGPRGLAGRRGPAGSAGRRVRRFLGRLRRTLGTCRWPRRRCGGPGSRSARACWPRFRLVPAELRRSPAWRPTWPARERVSAARACSASAHSRPRSTGLARGAGRRSDVRRLQGWAAEVTGRGACRHPDGAVRMVLSGLTTFADRRRGAPPAGRPCPGAGAPGVLPVPEERAVTSRDGDQAAGRPGGLRGHRHVRTPGRGPGAARQLGLSRWSRSATWTRTRPGRQRAPSPAAPAAPCASLTTSPRASGRS